MNSGVASASLKIYSKSVYEFLVLIKRVKIMTQIW